MRGFAWTCVVLGVLLSVIAVPVAGENNRMSRQAAVDIAARGGSYVHEDRSPIPALVLGLGVLALGVTILAIRRPGQEPELPRDDG